MTELQRLLSKCQREFNHYIHLRDLAGCDYFKCLACGQIKDKRFSHAAHFYNVGHFDALRFDEDNCHLCCSHCNTFLHGNLLGYRGYLIKKIGIERFQILEMKAGAYKRTGHKWDRFTIEYKIKELKQKIKELQC